MLSFLTRLSLTAKVVLLVALMGSASAMATLYANWQMQRMDTQYQSLLQRQTATTRQLSRILEMLSDSDSHVYLSLLGADWTELLDHREVLQHLQLRVLQELKHLYPLMPDYELELDTILTSIQTTYGQADRAIDAYMRGQHEQAQHIRAINFTPSMAQLLQQVRKLQKEAHLESNQHAVHIGERMHHAKLESAGLSLLALLLVSLVAARIALRHVSRPIERLTDAMQQLENQRTPIPLAQDQERHDEIGAMARTLQRVGQSLEQAAALQRQMDAQRENQLLTEQLMELTSALPGTVFQMRLVPGQSLRLHFVSPQWVHMLGMPPDTPTDLEHAIEALRRLNPEATAEANRQFARSATTQQPVDFECRILRDDGADRWIKVLATPRPAPGGGMLFNGVWLDVHKETLQARALEKAKQQAEQSAHARSLLQASISHEIRTPLNAILGLAQVALKSPVPEPLDGQLHSILRAGMHLRGIVNEVLEFSKIDAGQLRLESTDFSLSHVLKDVVMMCQDSAKAKGLQLTHYIAPDVPNALRGDPHRIAQILLNYVNNAIKFTPVGQVHIHMRLLPESTLHRVVLHTSVQDTGLGIPADRLPQLFDPFQQADTSITRRFGGTGLGLAIARELARLMSGTTGVESQPGAGSTFWFTAVLEPARGQPMDRIVEESALQAAPPHLRGLHVLVVDDNALNRTVAQAMLEAGGLHVTTAADGQQALDVLQQHAPQYFACVLMDLQMPGLDGLSATRRLRMWPEFQQLPVIAMTAHTGLSDMQEALEAGMNAHLAKPLLESTMWNVLQQCLPLTDMAAPPALVAPDTPSAPAEPSPPLQAPSKADPTAQADEPAQEPLPPVFSAEPVSELAQLFAPAKFQHLVTQFTQDTQARQQLLHTALAANDHLTLRAEAHKITGTAATFGLLRLGHCSQQLTAALHDNDPARIAHWVEAIAQCATQGLAQLHAAFPPP